MDMVSSAHFSLSAHAVLSVLVTQTCSSQSLSASDTSVGISDSINMAEPEIWLPPSRATVLLHWHQRSLSRLWGPENKASFLIRFSPSPTSSPSHGISCHLYLQNTSASERFSPSPFPGMQSGLGQ